MRGNLTSGERFYHEQQKCYLRWIEHSSAISGWFGGQKSLGKGICRAPYSANNVRGNLKPNYDNWNIRGNLKPREDGPAGDERPRQAGEAGEVGGEKLPHWLRKKISFWIKLFTWWVILVTSLSKFDILCGGMVVKCVLAAPVQLSQIFLPSCQNTHSHAGCHWSAFLTGSDQHLSRIFEIYLILTTSNVTFIFEFGWGLRTIEIFCSNLFLVGNSPSMKASWALPL